MFEADDWGEPRFLANEVVLGAQNLLDIPINAGRLIPQFVQLALIELHLAELLAEGRGGDPLAGLGAGEDPARAVRTGAEGARGSQAAHDETWGARRTCNEAALPGQGGIGALAMDPQLTAGMRLAPHEVMRAIQIGIFVRREPRDGRDDLDDPLHDCEAV